MNRDQTPACYPRAPRVENPTRATAVGILGAKKMRELEEKGLMVVERKKYVGILKTAKEALAYFKLSSQFGYYPADVTHGMRNLDRAVREGEGQCSETDTTQIATTPSASTT